MAASSSWSTATRAARASSFVFGLSSVAAFIAIMSASITASAEDCAAANAAYTQAQQALSKATRAADTLADAYGQCMQGGGNCAPKKAAFDAALATKAKAAAALKTASARRQSACR